jgi:hypothetical protein
MTDEPSSVRSGSSAEAREEASYRKRLERSSPLLEEAEHDPEAAQPDVDALRGLVDRTDRKGTAFQSVAVAAVQILERALCYEREAAEAALSLGQQEKLGSMVDTIEQAAAVLRSTLDAEGGNVTHLCAQGDRPTPTDGQPWWFALTDALEVLEEGTGRMASLTTAQPDGSPARELSQLIAQLLRGHHDELLLEADDWIS